ncbi:peptidylprolyl isomerase [Roseovarius dicentrarchi]|uniref:peptidylprolyl isomerase n=1 Tax=Roseovarius dicentrarchi TaxID=2250573 RepID=UPI000DEA6642|nr:peptidylprolyl isomerase [Roseovarius dicentrarchi]
MFDRLKPIAATALLMGAVGTAPVLADDTAPTIDTVVATVGGTDILLGHMLVLRAGLPEQFADVPADVLYVGILDQLVQQTLLANARDGALNRRAELVLDNERRALMSTDEMADVIEDVVTDEAVQAYFSENYMNSDSVVEYKAAHILVETEEEAAKLAEEARGGADFGLLARDNSTGPSGPSGGDLGWFSDGMMVQPFQDAVANMEPGNVSDPVQTQFGWHVIKLNETRVKDAPTIDELRPEIEDALRQQAIEDRITELTEAGDIDRAAGDALDPEVLNQIDILEE